MIYSHFNSNMNRLNSIDALRRSEYYNKKITANTFYEGELPIKLEMIIYYSAKEAVLGDYHRWGALFDTHNVMVVSSKLKSVLETLNLPPHRFYPAEIGVPIYRDPDASGHKIVGDYFVFHFHYKYLQSINFSESIFWEEWVGEYVEKDGLMVPQFFNKLLEKGEIKDEADYWARIKEVKQKGDSGNVYPYSFELTSCYDIIGDRTRLYISPKAKKVFEENQLTGIRFVEHKPEVGLDTSKLIPKVTCKS